MAVVIFLRIPLYNGRLREFDLNLKLFLKITNGRKKSEKITVDGQTFELSNP